MSAYVAHRTVQANWVHFVACKLHRNNVDFEKGEIATAVAWDKGA